jgi:hypothetical protein
MPKYTRVSKFLAAAHIFTISCENPKILSQLLSALSLSRKFVHDHCCCPKSAAILTASKMEAILDFWRGCQNLSIIQWGGGGGGEGGGGCKEGRLPPAICARAPYQMGGGRGVLALGSRSHLPLSLLLSALLPFLFHLLPAGCEALSR